MAGALDFNNNCVTLNELFDKIANDFVSTAVVKVTIKNPAGDTLVNAQVMPFVAASDGKYRTVIESTVDLGDDDDTVSVEVIAEVGGVPVYQAKDAIVYIRNRKLSGTG